MSWREFEEGSPELALLGASLLSRKIAYLATIRKDGSPRIHPVRPIVGDGYLFIFIDHNSPKRSDLLRDGRYAIHCSVIETNGLSSEFMIIGVAEMVDNPELRQRAVDLWGAEVPAKYALFEFSIDRAIVTEYTEERKPVRYRWRKGSYIQPT
jgi:hypothetical protein